MPTTITSAGITFNDATTLTSADGVPSAVKLQTARTINGVSFDGTADITAPALTSATAQTASGTSVDFTGIPSWVKRITVMFYNVSTNGSSPVMVQLGKSSGVVTSGYLGSANGSNFTTGFTDNIGTSPTFRHGMHIITLLSSNIWIAGVTMGSSGTTPANNPGGFSVDVGGTLDRVRITTQNGTDLFDAGTINIMYE